LAYIQHMVFIETTAFTRRVVELMDDDDSYARFQRMLIRDPEAGDLIQGTGGLRKIRVSARGHGKRGGARVIYYHFRGRDQIALLMIYLKSEQADLTADHRRALKTVIERWS